MERVALRAYHPGVSRFCLGGATRPTPRTGTATRGISVLTRADKAIKQTNRRHGDDLTSARRAQCSTDTQPTTEALLHAWGGREDATNQKYGLGQGFEKVARTLKDHCSIVTDPRHSQTVWTDAEYSSSSGRSRCPPGFSRGHWTAPRMSAITSADSWTTHILESI